MSHLPHDQVREKFAGRTTIWLFHESQTREYDPREPRVAASFIFWSYFGEFAERRRYALWSEERERWQTRSRILAWDGLSPALLRRHVDRRDLVGVLAKPRGWTRFVMIDHDFHGRDRQVFLEQEKILLNHFHGDGWHQEMAQADIDGGNHVKCFREPRRVADVTKEVGMELAKLDQQHPELAECANACGMASFSEMELYPSSSRAVRLPLGSGRLLFLDKPIYPIQHKGRTKLDVVSYVRWLADDVRQYMTADAVLNHLEMHLGPSYRKVSKPADRTEKKTTPPPDQTTCVVSGLGNLKNCCRKKITDFWRGEFNPPNSLNTAIIVSARILCFENVSQDTAAQLLCRWVREIPESAHSCSCRLRKGRFREIDREIKEEVGKAYDGNAAQPRAEISSAKLRKAVSRWELGGFRLHDKTTWDNAWSRWNRLPEIEFTEQERASIRAYLMPELKITNPEKACAVAGGVIKLVAIKQAEGNGIADAYWRAYLTDQFDIAMGDYGKWPRIKTALLELGLITIYAKPKFFMDVRKGTATRYAVGTAYANRVGELGAAC